MWKTLCAWHSHLLLLLSLQPLPLPVFLPLQITACAAGSQVALPSQNCTSSEPPSAASAGSSPECWLSDENAPQHCQSHPPLWLTPVLPHTFPCVTILTVISGRDLPWNLITPTIYHVYFLLLACNLLLSGCVPAMINAPEVLLPLLRTDISYCFSISSLS